MMRRGKKKGIRKPLIENSCKRRQKEKRKKKKEGKGKEEQTVDEHIIALESCNDKNHKPKTWRITKEKFPMMLHFHLLCVTFNV